MTFELPSPYVQHRREQTLEEGNMFAFLFGALVGFKASEALLADDDLAEALEMLL